MQLCTFVIDGHDEPRFGCLLGEHVVDLKRSGGPASLSEALRLPALELMARLNAAQNQNGAQLRQSDIQFRAPIDEQEVWAAGVTYLRSRDARMEESTQKDAYDQVYDADRPEIFFKATPHRVSGPGEPVAIRADSSWDVPEPELVLVMNSRGEVVGYTVGNDVSSRSIEGENPLYLPQAKLYSRSAALGPTIVLTDELTDVSNLRIGLTVQRDGAVIFEDETSTSQLHRTFEDLVSYLFRANTFPSGVFLMTGTGIVPPSEFTLQGGDTVTIDVEGIGALVNPVLRLDS